MKNKMKKLMSVIVGLFLMAKENIVKATSMQQFTQTYYGIRKIPDYSKIMYLSALIIIPITLIIGFIIYLKKKKESKCGRIIIKIAIILLSTLAIYSIFQLVGSII